MTHALKEAVERIVGQWGGSCTEVVFEGDEAPRDYISPKDLPPLCHRGRRTEQLSSAGRMSPTELTTLLRLH